MVALTVCGTAIGFLPKNMAIVIHHIFHNSLQKRHPPPPNRGTWCFSSHMLYYQVLFLIRELSCWWRTDRRGINPLLKNLHPLMRGRIFHILISGSVHFKPVFFSPLPVHHGCQVLQDIFVHNRPQLGLRVTLQRELTQQEAIPTPEWPAILWLYVVMAARLQPHQNTSLTPEKLCSHPNAPFANAKDSQGPSRLTTTQHEEIAFLTDCG